jgi:transcriptional regulator with XRE-family HTH domain
VYNLERGTSVLRLKLKEIAEKHGFSPQSLARASGVSYSTILRVYRNPYRYVTTLTLGKLASTLGIASPELIEELPEEAHQPQESC